MWRAISLFFRSGLRNADERLARTLAPRASRDVDRYLASSLTIRTIDRLLRRWPEVWSRSVAYTALLAPLGATGQAGWKHRYDSIGRMLMVGSITHVALTLAQGPRPGWYWTMIPSMAIGFALLLLAASHSTPRS